MIKFKKIKKEIRIVGIDDGPLNIFRDKHKKSIIIGTIFRGGRLLEGVIKDEVEVDGMDSTEKIINIIKRSSHKDIRVIMLDGITFAGFNIVDIKKLYRETNLGVIAVTRKFPNFEKIKNALKNFDDGEKRWKLIMKSGKIHKVEVKNDAGKQGQVYFQKAGLYLKDAKEIIKISTTRGLIPEPLRIAHIIASGIVNGESHGDA
ncbi:MAG: DUF99 family protein [Candidatus Altarchaeaceae archaeon]